MAGVSSLPAIDLVVAGKADFTSWVESDPNNKLSQTADRATWADMIRNEACYLYRTRTTLSDFSHEFDLQVSAIDVNADSTDNLIVYIWVVCESAGRPGYADVGKCIKLCVQEDGNSTTEYKLYLTHKDDAVQDTSSNLAVGTTYYIRITKAGATVTCTIYSDSNRSVVKDTLTIDLTGSASY